MNRRILISALISLGIVLGIGSVFFERGTTVLVWFLVAFGISGTVAVLENLRRAINASLLFLALAFIVNQFIVAFIRIQVGFEPLIVWERFFLGFAIIFSAGTLLSLAGGWAILRNKFLFAMIGAAGAAGIALSI